VEKMKHEYHEGPEALERFEKGMTALFRAPKPGSKPTAKKAVRKRTTKAQKGSSVRGDSQS
jgi:hypothetical protein